MPNPAPTITSHPIAANENVKRSTGEEALQDAKSRVPENILWNWSSYAINLLVTFLIAPLLVHRLGNLRYGVWGVIGQVIEYSFLLDFGNRIAIQRYVAKHLALDQPQEINKVITSGLGFSLLSVVLTLASGGVLAYLLPRYFPIPPELIFDTRLSVMVLAVGVAATFPGSVFFGCLAAISRYDLIGIRKVAPAIVRALLLWFFLERGCGLVTVAVVSTLAVCLAYGMDFVFTRRTFPLLSIHIKYFDWVMLCSLFKFSVYVFVLSISARLIFMTDNIVVGLFLGPAAVTFYSVGMTLAATLRDTIGNVTTLYAPLAYQMHALDQRDSLRRLFIVGSRIALAYVLPGTLGLAILGPRFLGLWMGPAFVQSSGPVLILLAIECAFFALQFCSVQILYATHQHHINAWFSLGNAIVNLLLSILMIRWLGAVGVAWGTLIPAFVVEAVIIPIYTASLMGVSPLHFYRSAILRPVIASLPYGLWLWLCLDRGFVHGYGSLVEVLAPGLALYLICLWKLSLDDGERALACKWLSRLGALVAGARPAWGARQA